MNQDKDYKNTQRDIKRKVKSINKSIDKDNDLSAKKFSKHINNIYQSLADKQFDLVNSINRKFNKSFKNLSESMMGNQKIGLSDLFDETYKHQKKVFDSIKSQGKSTANEFTNSMRKGFTDLSKASASAFNSISQKGSKMTQGLSKNIDKVTEDLRDWSVALNVDSLADKLDDTTKSVREYRIEMSKHGIDKDEFRDLEDYAEGASARSKYTIDKSDILEAMNELIGQGYKDPNDLKVYSELFQKFKYLGGEIGTFTEIVDTFNQAGFGGADGVKAFTSQLYALQNSGLGVSIKDLSETINEFNGGKGGFRALANGNKELYDKYIEGAMSLTSANSDSFMGGIDKALLNIMKLDPESLADMASQNNAGWLIDVQKQMRSGDMKEAAANFLDNYNKQRAQMISSGGQNSWQTFSKEMDWGDLREDQISDQSHIDSFLADMDKAQDIIKKDKLSVDKSIDTMNQQVGLFNRMSNFLKSNPLTSKVADIFDDLDMSFTEILFAVNQGTQLIGTLPKLGKGLKSGGATVFKGLSKVAGIFSPKIADNITKAIPQMTKTLPMLATATSVVSSAAAINQMTSDKREDKWSGGTKLAFTGGGAVIGGILGGPVGAQIGSSIGSLIGDAIGDELGPALMHGWDSSTEFLSNMKNSFLDVASSFWNGIVDFGKNTIYTLVGLWDMFFEQVFKLLGLDWGQFKDGVSSSIASFEDTVSSGISSLSDLAGSAWDSLTSTASSFWDTVSSLGSQVWNSIGQLASGIFDKIKSALANSPLGVLINGVGTIIDKIGDVLSSANTRGQAIVDGSHKTGLETVPKDGYIAELHKNEAVLTSDQADDWRSMNNNPESFFDTVYKSALSSYDRNAMIQSYKAQSSKNNQSGGFTNYSSLSTQDQLGIWKFFRDAGYSKEATAGIMGNLSVETGGTFNPSTIQGNGAGPAAGIAQWENYNTQSGRWENLNNYSTSLDKSWDDLQTQLQFIDQEMQGKDPTTLQKLNDYYGGYNGYKQITDVASATSAFLDSFERTGVTSDEERLKAATEAYSQFNQYKQGTPWVPNDQVALLHQGEMVVPAENNPYTSSATSSNDDSSLSDVIDTLKWGITRLESAIRESSDNQGNNYSLSNSSNYKEYSESDKVFRFATP